MGVLKSIAKYEASKATGGLSEMVPGMQSNVMKAKNVGEGMKAIKNQSSFKERNTKTASYIQDYKKGLASAGALASVALGVAGARKLHSKMETESVWRRLQKEHPEITSDATSRENFEVLQKFSPDLASNISTARSYMQRMANASMTPHEFVKDLTNIQKTRDSSGVGTAIERAATGARFDFGGTNQLKRRYSEADRTYDLNQQKFQYQQDLDDARMDQQERRFDWEQNR